jgi:hypothetical protein
VALKFPCLTIDGNADSRGTSRQLLCFTLFAQYFLLNPFVFYQIKLFFLLWGMVFGCHIVTFAIFSSTWNLCSKAVFLVSKLACFASS